MSENVEIYRAIGNLEGKLDLIIANQVRHIAALDRHAEDDDTRHEGIDKRMRSLEESRADAGGRNSIFGAIAGLFGGAIAAYVGKHFS